MHSIKSFGGRAPGQLSSTKQRQLRSKKTEQSLDTNALEAP